MTKFTVTVADNGWIVKEGEKLFVFTEYDRLIEYQRGVYDRVKRAQKTSVMIKNLSDKTMELWSPLATDSLGEPMLSKMAQEKKP